MLLSARPDLQTRCLVRHVPSLYALAMLVLCMIASASDSAVVAIRGVRRVSGSH